MNRIVVVGLMVAATLAVFTTGVVFAQSPQPPAPGGGGGMGPGGGRGDMGFIGANGEEGPLDEYMVSAIADALGITADEVESRHEAGETAYQIALDLDFTADEIHALLRDARLKAWAAAAADGVVSQEQADWMKSRPSGMGYGNCDGTAQRLGVGMGGWRFQQSTP
ncbi:MAG: hypothetical protein V1755_03130 [Chloroflexota bacterium]